MNLAIENKDNGDDIINVKKKHPNVAGMVDEIIYSKKKILILKKGSKVGTLTISEKNRKATKLFANV